MNAEGAASMTARHAPAASRDPHYWRGVVLVLLAACFWSTSGILVRSIDAASPWQILGLRASSAALMLFCVLLIRYRHRVLQAFRVSGWTGVVGGLCQATASSAFIFAITSTTVANAMFLGAAAPFFAALLAWVLIGERVPRATWTALALALVGVGVMVADGVRSGTLFGNAMALLSSLSFAGYVVALRIGKSADMLPAACMAGVFGGVLGASFSDLLAISGHDFAICVVLGVVQIGMGMLCFTLGSRHVPAAELTLLALVEIILAPLWVWIGVGETPSALTLLGGAIVLSAIVGRALAGARSPD
ncbi:MAG: DMT family transporter [Gammaproteobacteria bacterium]